jgi:predicted amidophosphoribosyltransferase
MVCQQFRMGLGLDEVVCLGCGKKVFEQGKSYTNGYCEKCDAKMMKELKVVDEERELEVETMEGLVRARKAFNDYLSSLGYDSAYWRVKFIADGLGSDLRGRLWRVILDDEQPENTNDD